MPTTRTPRPHCPSRPSASRYQSRSGVKRLAGLLALGGLAVLVSGCVVAPVGYRTYGAYPVAPVYIDPAPVVVVPGGYGYGYGGHGGYRGYRGHGGHWR